MTIWMTWSLWFWFFPVKPFRCFIKDIIFQLRLYGSAEKIAGLLQSLQFYWNFMRFFEEYFFECFSWSLKSVLVWGKANSGQSNDLQVLGDFKVISTSFSLCAHKNFPRVSDYNKKAKLFQVIYGNESSILRVNSCLI